MSGTAPILLLSMPQMADPNFAKTVVLLCDYGPEGAFGLVLNRPTDMPASAMVRLEPPVAGGNDLPLWIGGPVEPERGWILLSHEPHEDFKVIRDGLFLSTSQTLLREVLEANPAPRARVIAGYAGWGPGQLESELAEGAWLLAPAEGRVVFEVAYDEMWTHVVRSLGVEPATLVASRGVH